MPSSQKLLAEGRILFSFLSMMLAEPHSDWPWRRRAEIMGLQRSASISHHQVTYSRVAISLSNFGVVAKIASPQEGGEGGDDFGGVSDRTYDLFADLKPRKSAKLGATHASVAAQASQWTAE